MQLGSQQNGVVGLGQVALKLQQSPPRKLQGDVKLH